MTAPAGTRLREVGWETLRLAGPDAVTAGLPAEFEVLHWHGDACALPAGATLLASTPLCPVQMFRMGRTVGMQFHPEIDGPTACVWAAEDADFVLGCHGPAGVELIQRTSEAAAKRSEPFRRRMLEQVLQFVTAV